MSLRNNRPTAVVRGKNVGYIRIYTSLPSCGVVNNSLFLSNGRVVHIGWIVFAPLIGVIGVDLTINSNVRKPHTLLYPTLYGPTPQIISIFFFLTSKGV